MVDYAFRMIYYDFSKHMRNLNPTTGGPCWPGTKKFTNVLDPSRKHPVPCLCSFMELLLNSYLPWVLF